MKSCPTCHRTYPDDTLAFCLVDGSVLSASYEPEATHRIPPPRDTSPAATEVLKAAVGPSEPKAPLLSTIQAPAPQIPPFYSPPGPIEPKTRSSVVPLLLVGIAVLLVGILGVVIWGYISQREKLANTQPPSSKAVADNANQSKSVCGHTLGLALHGKWIQMGGETGKLGCPTADAVAAPASPQGTSGQWVQFARGDGGYLIQHESGPYLGKVFEVTGCMFKLYASQGGTRSWLGFPVGDGFETGPGARQEFEGGYIVWDSKTSQCQAHKN